MTQGLGVFVTPLLLLPGVGLLLMSTQARYGQLHGEFHHLEGNHHDVVERGRRLLRRGVMFRNALVGLYLAASFLALASLVGGILSFLERPAHAALLAFTFLGVVCLLFAAVELVREARLSLEILEDHFHDLEKSAP